MRHRLILVALATTSMVALAFVVPLAALVRTLADERARSTAERNAQALANVLGVVLAGGAEHRTLEDLVASLAFESDQEVSVFLPDGTVLGAAVEIDTNVLVARQGRAFTTVTSRGVEALVPVLTPDEIPTVVRVTVSPERLQRMVRGAWLLLGLLGVALVGLAVAVADRLGRSMVRPVERLADAANRLGSGHLGTRVDPDGPPELVGVGRAFNRLAERVQLLLVAEREAVADLSHRLRTPLTALRLDAEGARDPELSARLVEDIEELERAVDRAILEARRPMREATGASADLGLVVSERAAFWGVLAGEQDRRWAVRVPPGEHLVPLASEDLQAAIDALIDNVFAHTPERAGCQVVVEAAEQGGWRLVVEDEGPGFAGETALARGVSGRGSTGLGLDIVRRTAERAGGTLTLSSGTAGGARVEVWFGPELSA